MYGQPKRVEHVCYIQDSVIIFLLVFQAAISINHPMNDDVILLIQIYNNSLENTNISIQRSRPSN